MKENLALVGLIVLIFGLCIVGYLVHIDTRSITFKVNEFSVVIRQKIVDEEGFTAENLPITFRELSKLPVKEISWSEYVPDVAPQGRALYRWYDWVPNRGYLHNGTPFAL
ncbi:hypothetical protein KJ656_17915 [bacterium]|nr:hypothetical protein [bacterium]